MAFYLGHAPRKHSLCVRVCECVLVGATPVTDLDARIYLWLFIWDTLPGNSCGAWEHETGQGRRQ